MRIVTLIWSEILHRKLSFLIPLLAITVAVATCVAVLSLMDAHAAATDAKVAALNDDIRKIMKNLGFNIIILPREQNLVDFHASDFAQKTMPMEFVERLANSPDIITINHLRPSLVQKIEWPEQNRQVLMMGISGVVPFRHRNNKKPLSEPVPKGTMNIGSVLAAELNLQPGDPVTFSGRELTVGKIHPPQGNKDDITVWIDLSTAQALVDMPDRINLIQALECNCASLDRLAEIEDEISTLLGGEVQVIELSQPAIARAKAREGVKAAGQARLAQLAKLASVLLPLLITLAGVIVGLMALSNARERKSEVGILRAVGVGAGKILTLFVGKALLLGLVGSVLGYVLGLGLAQVLSGEATRLTFTQAVRPTVFTALLILTPILAAIASWLPATIAAAQDPAVVLREE